MPNNAQVQGAITFAAAQALLTRPNRFRVLNQMNQFEANYIAIQELINEKFGIKVGLMARGRPRKFFDVG